MTKNTEDIKVESLTEDTHEGITLKQKVNSEKKMTLSSKCDPAIKRAVMEEAEKRGISLSEQVEFILKHYSEVSLELKESKDDFSKYKQEAADEKNNFSKQLADKEEALQKCNEITELAQRESLDLRKENERIKVQSEKDQHKWELERLEFASKVNQLISESKLISDARKKKFCIRPLEFQLKTSFLFLRI